MAGWMAAAVVGSSLISSRAASKAASAQAAAADRTSEVQRDIFERQVELSKPYREAGELALNKLIPLATEYTPFTREQFEADPGYNFRLSEGLKALERSSAAGGNLLSGSTLKGIVRYGQGTASQEFQNAFNRAQIERQARMNPLQSLAGVGQTATQQLSQQAGQLGSNMAEAIGAAGQARASGYMGTANAIGGGLNQYLNYSQNQAQNQLLQQALARRGGGFGYTAEPGFSNTPSYLLG